MSFLFIIVLLISLLSCGDTPTSPIGQDNTPTDKLPDNSGNKNPQNNETDDPTEENTTLENYHPLLWKVSDTAGNYIYVFASLVVGNEDIYPLPSAVWTAYYDSVYYLVERDIYTFESLFEKIDDTEAQNTLISYYKKMMYLDSTIESHLPKNVYTSAVSLFTANNLTHKLYEYYNPIFWVEKIEEVIVRNAGLSVQSGTDYSMSKQAIQDNKFIAMTDIGEKQALLSSLSDKLQEMILLPYLAEGATDTKTEQIKAIFKAWIEGDADQLVALSSPLFAEIPTPPAEGQTPSEEYALYSEYNEKYLSLMSSDMYNQAKSYLDGGYTVFTSLDPSWLLGEDGILARFSAEGYTVTRLDTTA